MSEETTLGYRLRRAREIVGFSLGQAALRLDCPRAWLEQFERDETRPATRTFDLFAEVYEADVRWIATGQAVELSPRYLDVLASIPECDRPRLREVFAALGLGDGDVVGPCRVGKVGAR